MSGLCPLFSFQMHTHWFIHKISIKRLEGSNLGRDISNRGPSRTWFTQLTSCRNRSSTDIRACWRGWATRVILPGSALIMGTIVAICAPHWLRSSGASASHSVSATVFSYYRSQAPTILPAPELHALDGVAGEHFAAGLIGISDNDLLRYAHATQRDLDGGQGVMADYLTDAMSLIRLEQIRRGLVPDPQGRGQIANFSSTPRRSEPAPGDPHVQTAQRILQVTAILREDWQTNR